MSPQYRAFTCRYHGRSLRLISDVQIFPPHGPTDPAPAGKVYKGLYDTGATHSSISPRVVADLQLPSIGAINVGVGGGTLTTTSHLVNIGLPNSVMFAMFRVSQMTLHGGIDVLIGMDIIGSGDFSVTQHNGSTTFSFCVPSRKEIDFTDELTQQQKSAPVHSQKAGRNDPCPCGSGKKYKKCHGR